MRCWRQTGGRRLGHDTVLILGAGPIGVAFAAAFAASRVTLCDPDPAARADIPARLAESIVLWRDQPPSAWDLPHADELFPAASQQYVLYGMGFAAPKQRVALAPDARLDEVRQRARALASALPANRDYLTAAATQLQAQTVREGFAGQ